MIISVISGIAIMAGGATYSAYGYSRSSGANIIVGLLTIILGCLFSWIGSFFAYGFGQLIENTDYIRSNTQRKE